MIYCAAVDAVVNPSIAPGLEALRWHLLDHHYSDVAAFDICHHVLEEGTPAGCSLLEAEDEAAAEAAFVDALPELPYDHECWGAVIDHEAAASADTGIFPAIVIDPLAAAGLVGAEDAPWEPQDGPDAPDAGWYHPYSPNHPANRPAALPSLSGGSPEWSPEYEPTAEDLADLAAWSEELDRRRSWDEQTARWNDERWAAGDRPAR